MRTRIGRFRTLGPLSSTSSPVHTACTTWVRFSRVRQTHAQRLRDRQCYPIASNGWFARMGDDGNLPLRPSHVLYASARAYIRLTRRPKRHSLEPFPSLPSHMAYTLSLVSRIGGAPPLCLYLSPTHPRPTLYSTKAPPSAACPHRHLSSPHEDTWAPGLPELALLFVVCSHVTAYLTGLRT